MLALRPYLSQLTNAEFFTISTACLASIGGAFLAILAQLGVSGIHFLTRGESIELHLLNMVVKCNVY